MSFEIAKAGWLYRQSTVLKRWRRQWFVLYLDGNIKYFETPDSHMAEEAEMMSNCACVNTGNLVRDVEAPPSGMSRDCLMNIVFRNKMWTLCADSPDDLSAWRISLDQARAVQSTAAAPQVAAVPYGTNGTSITTYPGQTVIYTNQAPGITYGTHPPAYVIQGQPNRTTVIYTNNNDYYPQQRVFGGGLMWGPLLWW